MALAGIIGVLVYSSNGTLTITRCMVNVGTVNISPLGEQFYGGVIWVVFPTDKHPTIREFMAVGDFATVQNVEEKLIELGYTKIM